jgi:hypothetical protein
MYDVSIPDKVCEIDERAARNLIKVYGDDE